jgi:hypothetical protein
MLRRNVDDRTEFMMFTLWDSLEAVKAFGEHVGFVVLSSKLVPTLHCGIEHRAADDPGGTKRDPR